MKQQRKTKALAAALCLCLCMSMLLAGCGEQTDGSSSSAAASSSGEPVSGESYYFDTVCDVSVYDMKDMSKKRANQAIQDAFQFCSRYENKLSKTKKGSDIWNINHAGGKPVKVSDITLRVIQDGIEFGKITDGKFDITVGKAEDLYDFHAEKHHVPTAAQLKNAVKYINYKQIHINGNQVSMGTKKGEIDLGGIAKGYIADRLAHYLETKCGVTSAIISLGGNIVCIGSKGSEDFNVGIEKPFSDQSEIVGSTRVHDATLVTSGVYERYFRKNGKLYHHILDPKTGKPVDSDILGVTIISTDGHSMDCDALATTCLILGKKKAMAFMKEHYPKYKVLIIDTDNQITKTDNLKFTKA